jgi:hypothetical protein
MQNEEEKEERMRERIPLPVWFLGLQQNRIFHTHTNSICAGYIDI